MTNDAEYSALLNDAEVNLLADLFLDFSGLRRSPCYRSVRGAVILAEHSANGADGIYDMLAAVEQIGKAEIRRSVRQAIDCVLPLHDKFNARFVPQDGARRLTMPPLSDPDDVILFLGTVFAYLRAVNYKR